MRLLTWHWPFSGRELDWFEWRKALNKAASEGTPLRVDAEMHEHWLDRR